MTRYTQGTQTIHKQGYTNELNIDNLHPGEYIKSTLNMYEVHRFTYIPQDPVILSYSTHGLLNSKDTPSTKSTIP